MDILKLDEAQGLTAEMVRDWLRQQEPRIKRTTNVMTSAGMGDVWTWPSGDTIRDAKMDAWLSSRVKDIALLEGRTVQSLLREINPRMRLGLPSDAAVDAHRHAGGVWIGCHGELGHGGSIVFLSFDRDDNSAAIWDGEEWRNMEAEMFESLPSWRFWPCDAHGNKTRWPERDGVML